MNSTLYNKYKPTTSGRITAERFVAWAKYYFGDKSQPANHLLRNETPEMHHKMALAFAGRFEKALVTAPRGYAKTTWCRLWVMYCACYHMEPLIAMVAKPTQGRKNAVFIRNQLATNKKLHITYGNLVPKTTKARQDEAKRKDNDEELTLTNGVVMVFTTIEGSVHGLSDLYRPTLIVCEDLQAKKHMKEVSTLQKHQELFDNDIVFALDPQFGKIIVIGNNYGVGSIVNNILVEVDKEKAAKHDVTWYVVNFDIFDEKGNSVWEDRYPTKKLRAKEREYRIKGKGHIFDAQMRNIPDDSLQKRIDGIKFHNNTIERINGQNFLISDVYPYPIAVNVICAIDPAFSDSKSSDMRAKVIMAKGKFPIEEYFVDGIWILDYTYDQSDPSKIPDWIMIKHKQWCFNSVVVEAIGGQLIYKYMINEKLLDDVFYKRNPFDVKYVRYHRQSKGDRIWRTISLSCEYGRFFIKHNHHELIEECDNFGYHIRNDGIHLLDAIQMGDAYTYSPKVIKDTEPGVVIPKRLIQFSKESQLEESLERSHKSWQLW